MKVLVADDDPVSRCFTQQLLERSGCEVRAVEDGQKAWDVMNESDAPSLLVLDWMMPGIEGPDLCRRLRKCQRSQYVYIILLTARSEKDDVILGMEAGADAFLTKPVSASELKSRIAAARRVLEHQNTISRTCGVPTALRNPVHPDLSIESGTASSLLPFIHNLDTDPVLTNAARVSLNGVTVPCLGKIAILNKVGEGGMATVYRGFSTVSKQHVAVKVMSQRMSSQRVEAVTRFYREAQIAASVQSEHVVSVFEVDESAGILYLTMEYVDGISAGDFVEDNYRGSSNDLQESMVLDLCIAATKGLCDAHDAGVVHRDIKPDNILLPREDGRVNVAGAKLADLGIARQELAEDGLTATHVSLGTVGYMAPEQIQDARRAGKSADIFSMGVTLYALLSGRLPFMAASTFEMMFNTVSRPHVPLSRWRPVSSSIVAVVDKCLAKDPLNRYRNAHDLLQALESARSNPQEEFRPRPTVVRSRECQPARPGEYRAIAV